MSFSALFRKNHNGIYLSDVVITSAAFIASSFFVSLERALLICFLIGSISVVINIKWNLRSTYWFWIVLIIFFIVNVTTIFIIHLPSEFKMAVAFAPLVIVEGMALLGVINLIERRNS